MGAMGAAALSRATKAGADYAQVLKRMELEASYRSAGHLGFDELISPVETRNRLLVALQQAIYSRQQVAEPVQRTVITP